MKFRKTERTDCSMFFAGKPPNAFFQGGEVAGEVNLVSFGRGWVNSFCDIFINKEINTTY